MENGEINRVKDVLKTYPKGITIAELAKQLALNRISTSKYLNMLLASGQAEMRIFGPSKVFYPSQRIPLSAILNFSTSHLLVMDDNLTIIDANDALLRFFALEKKDLAGQRVDFSPLAVYFDSTLWPQLKKALESQESTLETRVTLQGKEHILEIKCIPTVFESGDHGVSLIADDITEITQYRLHLERLVEERAKELQITNENLKREINNHKKARSELKISEIKYRELVENANSIIIKTDTEGNGLFFNEFAQHFFGYTESEILGKSISDLIVPETDSSGKNIREIRQQLRTNPDLYGIYEGENLKKNGERVWISWAHRFIRDVKGEVTGILSIGNDITERKRAEEALKVSEERFRLAMEASSDGIWDWDITTDNGYFSPAYYRMLGYEPDAFPPTGQTWVTLIHPDDKERALSINRDCIENRCQSFELEYRLKAKDGSWKWILGRGNAVSRDAGGRALRIIGTHVDITERKQMEDALRISEERFRRIFDDGPLGMTVINPNYRFILVNRRFCDMFGYTEEELLEKSIDDVTHPDDIYTTFENLRNFYTGNLPRAYHEKRYLKKDGSVIWVAVTVTPLRDRENRVTSTISIIEDITKRKRDESRLIESEAMLREVLNNANDAVFLHELTPEGPGRFLLVNDQATRWLGYTKEEFMEMSPRDIVPENIFEKIRSYNSKMLLDDIPITFESVHQRKDGSTYPVEVSAHKFRLNENDVVLSTVRDITDRKQTENAIRENHVRLMEAMDLAHLANWELDHKTGMYTFDDRFYSLYGTTAEREGGYRMPADVYFREFVHPDDRGRINEELERCRELSDPDYISQLEHRIIRRDGGIRYINVRSERITDNDGHIVKIHGVNQDITERRIAEEKLQRSEQKLSAIVDFLPDATFVIDASGTVIAWNRAMEDLTGRKAGEMVGRGNFEHGFTLYGTRAPILIDFVIYPDMKIPETYHIIKHEKNKLVARTYSTHLRSDGLTLWGFAVPLYDSNGNLVGAIESMRDVTEMEKLENIPTTYNV